ncbi:MAG: arginine--tRNA ligase [Planctomycetes bacterium]|nr:arginine--tRNA ligase [Planctomycetota bacterium]
MIPAIDILEERISDVMADISGEPDSPAIVRLSKDPKFGDYQVNGVMALAKKTKAKPRELAEKIVEKIDISDICEAPEIAGPGFINLRLKPDYLAKTLLEINADKTNHLGINKTNKPKTIVVDFSGPNIAKQMHVGHLRSTIIGDCICRMLEFLGHDVKRQNHIGDWGTSLGKVILGLWHLRMASKHGEPPYYKTELSELQAYAGDKDRLKELCQRIRDRHEKDWQDDFVAAKGDAYKFFGPFLETLVHAPPLDLWEEITTLYQYVNLIETSVAGMGLTVSTRKKGDNAFQYFQIEYEFLSRHITTMLQDIDNPDNKQEKDAWNLIKKISLEHCNEIYKMLDIFFDGDKEIRGESFYRDMLPEVVAQLKKKGLAEESDGAICAHPDGFKNKEGERLPLIIQKTDGAYLYATTDLAAIRYRVGKLKADTIVYVTDARQALHFEMVFAVAKMAGWSKDADLKHVTFGSVLGEDGKPFKTRSGENIKLKELLEEAVGKARKVVNEKNPELSDDKKEEIANAVGIGAVKYADYSNNRTSDYIFSFEKMLAMDGNTAPYMQYAYARIKSIERKAQSKDVDIKTELAGINELNLTDPTELDLAKHLCRYGEAIEGAAADYKPNFLTSYLYELAQKFSAFYTNCPVLKADKAQRPTRLLLCDLTAKTIGHGLHELLGINVVEQM